MQQGLIERAQMSKSGKSLRILVNGQWYSTNNLALQSATGRNVQFNVGTSEYMGNTIMWANDAELLNSDGVARPQNGGGVQVQSSTPSHPHAQPTKPLPAVPVENMAFMPFVSNTVAHAIQAGAIKSPEEIYAWAQKAFNTAKNLVIGQQLPDADAEPFDDDIPF